MATIGINEQLYPFSTEDNKAIPLDIIRPLALIRNSLAVSVLASVTIPTEWKLASFYSPEGCYVEFFNGNLPGALVNGVAYPDTLFVPPGCIVMSTVTPGIAKVLTAGVNANYVVMQHIQKWAGLALSRNLSKL